MNIFEKIAIRDKNKNVLVSLLNTRIERNAYLHEEMKKYQSKIKMTNLVCFDREVFDMLQTSKDQNWSVVKILREELKKM